MTETVGEGADIVERLYWVSIHGDQMQAILIMEEAAKEIKRLRGELVRPLPGGDVVGWGVKRVFKRRSDVDWRGR